MPSHSITLKVLIGSPSDLDEERQISRTAIYEWNDLHCEAEGVTLLPLMWETHTTPAAGERPQAIVNKQVVDKADILIGLFWTKLGTHTGEAASGTVEEIDRVMKANKAVMLYFSERPVKPGQIDLKQMERLAEFKAEKFKTALAGNFSSPDELKQKLLRDLTRQVRTMKQSGLITKIDQRDLKAEKADEQKKQLEEKWERFQLETRTGFFHSFHCTDPYITYGIFPLAENVNVDFTDIHNSLNDLPALYSPKAFAKRADHVRTVRPIADEKNEAVTAIYRDGRILSASAIPKIGDGPQFDKIANFIGTERSLFELTETYAKLLRRLGIRSDLQVRFALHNVQGFRLIIGSKTLTNDFDKVDQPTINPPLVILPASANLNDIQQIATSLRPAINWVWQQVGAPECLYFDDKGQYQFTR